MTEFVWLKVLATLPRKNRPAIAWQKIHLVGTPDLPKPVEKVLSLGPKFCEHPRLDKTELLSLVRNSASRVSSEDFNRCVSAGVDVLPKEINSRSSIHSGKIVSLLRDSGLRLLE